MELAHENASKKYINYTTPSSGFNEDVIEKIIIDSKLSELQEYQNNVSLAFDEMRIQSSDDDSAIKENLLFCNHTPDFEDFSILAGNKSDFKVTLMESLLINRDHPPLNKNKQSLPLELFHS